MSQENFQQMSPQELKAHIRANPKDQDAVHEAVVRLQQNGKEVTGKEFIQIAKKKLDQQ